MFVVCSSAAVAAQSRAGVKRNGRPAKPTPTPPTAATRTHTQTGARDRRGEHVCAVSFRSRVFVRVALECKRSWPSLLRLNVAGRALRPNPAALQGQCTRPSAAPCCLPPLCGIGLPVQCCRAAAALLFPLCSAGGVCWLPFPFALCSAPWPSCRGRPHWPARRKTNYNTQQKANTSTYNATEQQRPPHRQTERPHRRIQRGAQPRSKNKAIPSQNSSQI
jgi:hypothetical protein